MHYKRFLYIDPIKQGLKPYFSNLKTEFFFRFLYIDPIKQGLKHTLFSTSDSVKLFLYIDPIKQGLKHFGFSIAIRRPDSFYT